MGVPKENGHAPAKALDCQFHAKTLNPDGSLGGLTIKGTSPYLTNKQAVALAKEILRRLEP